MLDIFQIKLTSFKQERTIRVYVPQNYNLTNKRYPLLYMHDGQNVFRDEDAIGGESLRIKNYLDKSDLEIIVVGIDSNPSRGERINEYCPWTNGEYSKRITGQKSSLGGLISTYAACQYPEIFNNIATISSGFYRNQEKIIELVRNSNLELIKNFYMDCGTSEASDEQISTEFLNSNKEVYESIKQKVKISRFQIMENAEHNYINFRKRIPAIFSFLFN